MIVVQVRIKQELNFSRSLTHHRILQATSWQVLKSLFSAKERPSWNIDGAPKEKVQPNLQGVRKTSKMWTPSSWNLFWKILEAFEFFKKIFHNQRVHTGLKTAVGRSAENVFALRSTAERKHPRSANPPSPPNQPTSSTKPACPPVPTASRPGRRWPRVLWTPSRAPPPFWPLPSRDRPSTNRKFFVSSIERS